MERGLDWSRSGFNTGRRPITTQIIDQLWRRKLFWESLLTFENWWEKGLNFSEICDIMLFCVDGHSVPIYWRHMVQAPYEDMRTPHWGGSGGWKTADWVQHGDGGELKTGEKSKFFFWTSEPSEAWSEKVPRPTRHPVAAAPWWSTPRWSTRPSWSSWPSWWSRPRACCLPGNNWN